MIKFDVVKLSPRKHCQISPYITLFHCASVSKVEFQRNLSQTLDKENGKRSWCKSFGRELSLPYAASQVVPQGACFLSLSFSRLECWRCPSNSRTGATLSRHLKEKQPHIYFESKNRRAANTVAHFMQQIWALTFLRGRSAKFRINEQTEREKSHFPTKEKYSDLFRGTLYLLRVKR